VELVFLKGGIDDKEAINLLRLGEKKSLWGFKIILKDEDLRTEARKVIQKKILPNQEENLKLLAPAKDS
jgi:hypothetical protein